MVINERQKITFYRGLIDVLQYFDFEKVARVMKTLDWHWHLSENNWAEFEDGVDGKVIEDRMVIPGEKFLKRRVISQFEDMLKTLESGEIDNWAIKTEDGFQMIDYVVGCGGFRYGIHSAEEDEDTLCVQLEFIIEEWDTFD